MKLQQRMIQHINGGDSFSELHYRVISDGVDTDITRHVLTNGSPDYEVVADELHCGDETFDVLKAEDTEEMMDWVRYRAQGSVREVGE